MDVLIFNSGLGSRIADLIKDSRKSLLNVNGETILARQLRILADHNINKVIITTGPNANKIHQEVSNKDYPFEIVFVHSPMYAETNYIYSMFLASEHLNDNTLIMHGDLVFTSDVITKLTVENNDCVLIDVNKETYVKDFKALVIDGFVTKISTKLQEYDYGLQPIYKLSKSSLIAWKEKVRNYIEENKTKVYAEDALNELLLTKISLKGILIGYGFCKEIDDPIDFENVNKEICVFDYNQKIIKGPFEEVISSKISSSSKVIVVTFSAIKEIVEQKLCNIKDKKFIIYDKANPEKKDIQDYLELINNYNPHFVISIGGGSVIDFSKCLIDFSKILAKHIAIPTTCGTGSESTRFAVYYIDGIKQSLNRNVVMPSIAILDSSLLESLPNKVLLSSVLDAFAQSIESFWSNKATRTSQDYCVESIKIIYPILINGIDNSLNTLRQLHYSSNLAGRAINITTTTSAHALSYNITKLFAISHGFAVNMTLPYIWSLHDRNLPNFDDKMRSILDVTNTSCNEELINHVTDILVKYNVLGKVKYDKITLDYLVENVNLERLGNNPYLLSKNEIKNIYIKALGEPLI